MQILEMLLNPKDKRFKKYVGKTVTIPIVGRKIKIIKDNYADPEQGTGALKITPAHDFNDYDVGQRNKLEIGIGSVLAIDEDTIGALGLNWKYESKSGRIFGRIGIVHFINQPKENIKYLPTIGLGIKLGRK